MDWQHFWHRLEIWFLSFITLWLVTYAYFEVLAEGNHTNLAAWTAVYWVVMGLVWIVVIEYNRKENSK